MFGANYFGASYFGQGFALALAPAPSASSIGGGGWAIGPYISRPPLEERVAQESSAKQIRVEPRPTLPSGDLSKHIRRGSGW
jgi:hypothetical protein